MVHNFYNHLFAWLVCISLLHNHYAVAQDGKTSKSLYYRHELNIGLSGFILPNNQADFRDRIYNDACDALPYEREHDDNAWWESTAGTQLSYYYHINHRIALGAIVAFTRSDKSLSGDYQVPVQVPYYEWNGNIVYRTAYMSKYLDPGKFKSFSTFLMPSLKWSWLNNRWCSLYSKLSVGIHYQWNKAELTDFASETSERLKNSKIWFACVGVPLGWELGTRRVRGFLEIGYGSNFNLCIGLTYRFKRY